MFKCVKITSFELLPDTTSTVSGDCDFLRSSVNYYKYIYKKKDDGKFLTDFIMLKIYDWNYLTQCATPKVCGWKHLTDFVMLKVFWLEMSDWKCYNESI